MSYTTISLVRDAQQVRAIVDGLHAAGYATEDISVIFPQATGDQSEIVRPGDIAAANTHSGEGAAVGVVAGGVMGTALAWMTGAGLVTIPGLGAILAAGPILTILTGMGMGASLGGITGALIGMGVHEVDARRFTSSISDGRVLIAVRSDDAEEAHVAAVLMKRSGGEDIEEMAALQDQRAFASAAR